MNPDQKQSDPAFGSDKRAIAIVSDVDVAHRIWLAGAVALTCDRNQTPCDILTTYSAGEATLTGEIHPERHEVRPTSRIQEVSDEGLGGVLVIEADLKTFLQMKDEVEACYPLMVVIPVTSHPVSKDSAARIAKSLAWHQPLLHLIKSKDDPADAFEPWNFEEAGRYPTWQGVTALNGDLEQFSELLGPEIEKLLLVDCQRSLLLK